ncbi:MAG TPA: GldG family protein [Thermoanaerobaculia bacterium]|nr:GldG family protein [Thermoanaerobaculia bacterium]
MASLSRRQLIRTGTLSAGVLLTIALLVILNYFGWKYFQRFDWTGSDLYSLSEKTENVLKDLDRDVEFVVFLSPEQRDLFEPTRELLDRYRAASTRVKVRIVDPEKNLIEAQQLAQRYNLTSTGVVVAAGEDRRVIDSADLAELDFSALQMGGEAQMTGFKGEQLFTSAILQLVEGRKPKILFVTGHGERSLDDRTPRGFAGAQEILGADNFEIEEWASLGKNAVPAGTDLVVIAGPTGTFSPPELNALAAYVDGGGRLLVLLDPTLGQAAGSGLVNTGLEGWLPRYGVQVGQTIVIDPPNGMPFFGPETFFVQSYGDSPIVAPFSQGGLSVFLNLARSVGATGNAPAGLKTVELMRSSPEGWGETGFDRLENVQKDAADVQGPVPLAVAVEREAPAAPAGGAAPRSMRLVVIGDSDFAANQLLQNRTENQVLLANTFNWLVERESLLGIPPKQTEQVRLSLTGGQMRWVFLLSLLILPGLAIISGAVVYLRRRR